MNMLKKIIFVPAECCALRSFFLERAVTFAEARWGTLFGTFLTTDVPGFFEAGKSQKRAVIFRLCLLPVGEAGVHVSSYFLGAVEIFKVD